MEGAGGEMDVMKKCNIYIIYFNKIKWPAAWQNQQQKICVRPAKTRISLGIRPVWSESSLCAQWVAKDSMFLNADSEDSDQTRQMSRLSESLLGAYATFFGFVMRRLK